MCNYFKFIILFNIFFVSSLFAMDNISKDNICFSNCNLEFSKETEQNKDLKLEEKKEVEEIVFEDIVITQKELEALFFRMQSLNTTLNALYRKKVKPELPSFSTVFDEKPLEIKKFEDKDKKDSVINQNLEDFFVKINKRHQDLKGLFKEKLEVSIKNCILELNKKNIGCCWISKQKKPVDYLLWGLHEEFNQYLICDLIVEDALPIKSSLDPKWYKLFSQKIREFKGCTKECGDEYDLFITFEDDKEAKPIINFVSTNDMFTH